MIVFDYSFYGKNKLWVEYYRRGQSFATDTDRPTPPRLYGIMLRSIASRGGGLDLPPSLWKILEVKCPHELLSERRADTTALRYDKFTL